MFRRMIRHGHTLLVLGLMVFLSACGSTATTAPTPASVTPAPSTAPLKVVATYSILGDFVQQVGGEHIALTLLVGPSGDAHTYEPTPRDSAELAAAAILVENGLMFEPWLDDLYTASGSSATRVVASAKITPLATKEDEQSHSDEDPLAHPCKHFADTPTAVVADASAAALIPADHTLYELGLTNGAGSVAFSRDVDSEVRFYLGSDMPFTLLQGSTALTPEETQSVSDGCAAIKMVYTYDLAPGDYSVTIGPSSNERLQLVWEVGGEHSHGDHEAAAHVHGEYDPHVWHDPHNATLMVESIRDALIAADPAHSADYTANADAYLVELKALDTFITTEIAKLPVERRKLVTTHDTFGYFAAAYDFEVIGTALGVTTETSDPAAGEIAALVATIKAAGVPAIFTENVVNPSLMEVLANEAGVKLAPVLYTDALGEPGSAGATYLEMMRYNVTTIVSALAG